MDYEKKYNDALVDMKVIYPNLKGDAKKAVEHAFPELKESEDERIRKQIEQALIEHDWSVTYKVSKDDCLAYLEKQKERVPENEEMGTRKERKPADKLTLENPLTGEKVYKREIPESMMSGDPKDVEAIIHLAAKGWTVIAPVKTDDKAFEEWIDDWYQGSKEAGGCVVMSEAEFKNWSRGIRNMYQQKPAEWSEEDEKNMKIIIGQLESYQPDRTKPNPLYEQVLWLKSLRPQPHWKPTKVQLDALAIASERVDSSPLKALYNDLKKLM